MRHDVFLLRRNKTRDCASVGNEQRTISFYSWNMKACLRYPFQASYVDFFRMLSGVEGNLRKDLFLDHMSGNEQSAFLTLLQKHEDKQRAQAEFVKLCNAFSVLGVSEQEQKVVWSVLAAIFHLGSAGASKGK